MSPRRPSASGSCRTCRARPRSWHPPCVPWCVAARPGCRWTNDRWPSGPPGNSHSEKNPWEKRPNRKGGLPGLDSHFLGSEMVLFWMFRKNTLSLGVAHNSSDLCKSLQFGRIFLCIRCIPLIVSCFCECHTEIAHLSHDFDWFLVPVVWHTQQVASKFNYDNEAAWNHYLNRKREDSENQSSVFFLNSTQNAKSLKIPLVLKQTTRQW